jgi:DNA-binding NarL/FixJ family response regulator
MSGTAGTPLTPREQEITALIVEGLSNTQIANRLHLSSRTVTVAIGHLYRKAGVKYRAEFVEQAQQHASTDAATAARKDPS